MKQSIHHRLAVLLMMAGVLTAGCATTQTTSLQGSAAAAREAVAPATESAPSATVQESSGNSAQARLDQMIAERRRGDFPEVVTDDFGFTVTEQIRISGATHSRYDAAFGALEQGRLAEGIAALEALTRDEPALTTPWLDLGIAYGRDDRIGDAIAALQTAARLAPEHPVVLNELGIAYRRAGRFAAARAEYEKALAVFPDFHYARRNLAVLCDLYLADPACALEHYRSYITSAGDDAEVTRWIVDLERRTAAGRQE